MAAKPTDIGQAIKKFRTDCKMSRASFAKQVGSTGNSVYRYEAGLSNPDIPTLRRLLGYAIERDNSSTCIAITNEIHERTSPSRFGLGTGTLFSLRPDPPLELAKALVRDAQWLNRYEHVLLLAFMKMLRTESSDAMGQEVMRVVLRPWLGEAEAEFEKLSPQRLLDD